MPICSGKGVTVVPRPCHSAVLLRLCWSIPAPLPSPAPCQCPLWETSPVAKGGGTWKQQEFPSSVCFPSGLGGSALLTPSLSCCPAKVLRSCSVDFTSDGAGALPRKPAAS